MLALTLIAFVPPEVVVVAGGAVSTPKSVVDVLMGMIVSPTSVGSSGWEAPDAGGGTGLPVPAFVVVVVVAVVPGCVVVVDGATVEVGMTGGLVGVVVEGTVVEVVVGLVSSADAVHEKPVKSRKRSAPANGAMNRRMRAS